VGADREGERDGGRLWTVEDRDGGSEAGALIADMDLEEGEDTRNRDEESVASGRR